MSRRISFFALVFVASCKRHDHPAPTGAPEWTREPLPNPSAQIDAIDGTSATDVWAVGVGVYHYDGKAWTDATPPGLHAAMNAVSVVSPRDVWVAGVDGHVAHFDGASWRVEQIAEVSPTTKSHYDLIDVFASSEGAWVTDASKAIHRFDGASWSTIAAPRAAYDLWGTSLRDVWLPGGIPAHWDGTSWTTPVTLPNVGMRWARGSAPSDVWMVGWEGSEKSGKGAAEHFDGATWTRATLPEGTQVLWSISVPRRDEAWAVGNGGWAIAWNGTAWRGSPTGVTESLHAIYSPGGGVAFAAGPRLGPFVLHKR